MNKPTLSIILPSIRPYNLERLYNSILEATTNTFELIVVGPYSLPRELEMYPNIKVFRDWGTPTRASQIGACLAEGKYITWAADDGVYLPDSIDKCIEKLHELEKEEIAQPAYSCISAKYLEGNEGSFSVTNQPDSYYKLRNAYPVTPLIAEGWNILNVGFMSRQLFEDFGGWNCEYEACPMAHADLAARLQYMGVKIELVDIKVLKCEHMPGRSGDHGPICDAQTTHDTEVYIRNMSDKDYFRCDSDVGMSNWKESPAIWERRFGTKNIN